MASARAIDLKHRLETSIILFSSVITIKINYFAQLLIPKLIHKFGFPQQNMSVQSSVKLKQTHWIKDQQQILKQVELFFFTGCYTRKKKKKTSVKSYLWLRVDEVGWNDWGCRALGICPWPIDVNSGLWVVEFITLNLLFGKSNLENASLSLKTTHYFIVTQAKLHNPNYTVHKASNVVN